MAIQVQFVAGIAPITDDPTASAALYRDTLKLPIAGDGDYLSTDDLPGVKHFGVWPLSMAALSCFGQEEWPEDVPRPQMTVEFEVASQAAVSEAAEELKAAGYELIHEAREEPWGQTLARFLSPEGVLVGMSYTPWMHPES